MPTNKNAQLRYQILDRCFSDRHHIYTFDELLEKVNQYLCEMEGTHAKVKERVLRADINAMRKMLPCGVYLDVAPFEGKKCSYRYSERDFSLFGCELNVEEVSKLSAAIRMLERYRVLPTYRWLEEVITKLELRFGLKKNMEKLIAFSHNEQLKGLEYLASIIDATIYHRVLKIDYVAANGNAHTHLLHPYYVKQYNDRWFLYGLDESECLIKNLALDRIVTLGVADVPFIPNLTIDFDSFFEHVVGVTVPENCKSRVVTIKLRFHPERFKYVVSKPIHHTQQIEDKEQCVVTIEVCPTPELEQQIFSFGPDVEVMEPIWYREEIAHRIENTLLHYCSLH